MRRATCTTRRRSGLWLLGLCALLGLVLTASAETARSISPGTVVMQLPDARGAMERSPVEFNHAAHTSALVREGCEACHRINEEGLDPRLAATLELTDRNSVIDAFHGTCTGCHRERAASDHKGGPVTCGECHARRPTGEEARVAMAFDYSLHGRHAQAFPEKCETCHHVYDEAQKALRYERGSEEACRACHGPLDVERNLSLANASHRDCVSCHLSRSRTNQPAGPVLCVGCHEAEARNSIKRLEEVPRLVRGQKDTLWIAVPDARSQAVAFNHKTHEPVASSCSDCHHKRLQACRECHTLLGAEAGAGVPAVRAHHDVSFQRSCVGCHARNASHRDCAGCHESAAHLPGQSACVGCHSGPPSGELTSETPPPVFSEPTLAALPTPSDAFPETVTIDLLVDQYEASMLPHLKIVARLDSAVRQSSLAGSFHSSAEALCSGCHHQSPAGTRPPPCRSCHADAAPTEDRPGLKVAYHRQCLGCHIAMGVDKKGCTDCHATREVGS